MDMGHGESILAISIYVENLVFPSAECLNQSSKFSFIELRLAVVALLKDCAQIVLSWVTTTTPCIPDPVLGEIAPICEQCLVWYHQWDVSQIRSETGSDQSPQVMQGTHEVVIWQEIGVIGV